MNLEFRTAWHVLVWRLLISTLSLTVMPACHNTPFVWAAEVPQSRASAPQQENKIGRGDIIAVSVVGQPEMSSSVTVGSDGTIVIPNMEPVAVAGLTTAEAAAAVRSGLSSILRSPQVSISVTTRFVEVSVLGEVRSPGKYPVQAGDGVVSALAEAGGLTEFADKTAIYLIRAGEPVRIRFRMRDLLRRGNSATSFVLRDGDVLVVE